MASSLDGTRTCEWGDGSGTVRRTSSLDCIVGVPWFAPSLFFGPGTGLPSKVVVSDDGEQPLGGTTYHQLSYVVLIKSFNEASSKRLTEASRVKLFYDLTTLLPARLQYSIHTEGNDSRAMIVDVSFSDYRLVSGAQLPFHIVRSIERTPQMIISLSNVVLN